MRFSDLAWGSFVFANLSNHDFTYQTLESDKEFLGCLQTEPSLNEFERLREFLVNYGVHYARKDLADQYLRIWPVIRSHIHRLASETLLTCDFHNRELHDSIRHVFSRLQGPYVWGGDTVASKVLHFFNTELFVMWDSDIQVSYGKFSDQGYLEFLGIMQAHAIEVINTFQQLGLSPELADFLSEELGYKARRPLTKFLDDYNWVTITKGWPARIPEWLSKLEIYPPNTLETKGS